MDRQLSVNFYRIVQSGRGRMVTEVMQDLLGMTLVERQYVPKDHPIRRLERVLLEPATGFWIGDFMRFQTELLPSAPNDDGVQALPVTAIGHHAAFLFDPGTHVLAIQFRSELRVRALMEYLANFGHGSVFVAEPILKEDTVELIRTRGARAVEISVARMQNYDAEPGESDALIRNTLAASAAIGADTVHLRASVGARDGFLNRIPLIREISRLMAEVDVDAIKKIEVTPEEGTDLLNLTGTSLRYTDKVEIPANDPEQSYQVRAGLVRLGYDDKVEYIRTNYAEG
ncbi:hypothetical protein MCERH10_02436 [Caulobacteraceae bacterium]